MSRGDDRRWGGQWTTALVIAALGVAAVAGLAIAVQDQFEPNDQRSEATEVEPGTYENLELGGNDDWYAIDLQEGQELDVAVRFTHDEGDIDARIYPPGEDSRSIGEGASTTDDEQMSDTAPEDGTHYVRVYPYDRSVGSYDLEIQTSEPPAETQESDSGGSEGDASGDGSSDGGSDDGTDGDDGGSAGGTDQGSGDGGSTDGGSTDGNGGSGGDGGSGDDTLLLVGLGGLVVAGLGYVVYTNQ